MERWTIGTRYRIKGNVEVYKLESGGYPIFYADVVTRGYDAKTGKDIINKKVKTINLSREFNRYQWGISYGVTKWIRKYIRWWYYQECW